MKILLWFYFFIFMIYLIFNKCYFEYYFKYLVYIEFYFGFFFVFFDIKICLFLYLLVNNLGKMDENKMYVNNFLYIICLR